MPEFEDTKFQKAERQWLNYVIKKNAELDRDYQSRLVGISNSTGGKMRAGYKTLRSFYDGDHWSFTPEGGGNTRIYNYCFTIVHTYAAFMTNEPVEFDVPSADIKDEIENVRAETKETLLKKVLRENNFDLMFEESVVSGSLLGDSFIFGPIVRGKGKEKKIIFNRIKKPESIRIIWSDDSYDEIEGFIRHYWISEDTAESLFGDIIKKRKIKLSPTQIHDRGSASVANESSIPMVEFMEFWNTEVMVQIISNQLLDYDEHNLGFLPLEYIRNIPDPNRPWGLSDIENVLDIQAEYNEKQLDLSNITTDEANPKLFGKNLGPSAINAGSMEMIDIGDEGELLQDPRRTAVPPLEAVINNRRNAIFEIGGVPEILFGGSGVKEFSGRALSVFMQPVNNRIKGRQARWTKALKSLSANIFKLLEDQFGAGDLVGGVYDVDIFFPGTLLRNTTDEINKFNAKVQSMKTTMKNIGVPSPRDEMELMKAELSDPQITAEISRAPQLQLQFSPQAQQLAKQQAEGAGEPQLQEDENQPGDQPAPAAGAASAASPEGRVRQRNQQAGASTPIE